MGFSTLAVDLIAKFSGFEEGTAKAVKSLQTLEKQTDKVQASFRSAFKDLVPAIGVASIGAFVKSGIDAADALNDMSQRLGVSVKDLASFKLAAEQSGTSLDGVGAGIARLSRSIGDAESGNKQLANALSELGITARDPKEAFFQLADAVQRIDDPSKRAALLSQVLGKSYGELVPLLSQGGAALRQSALDSESFAQAMSRLAPEADKFNDSLAQLKSNLAGLAAQAIGPAVASFNEYIAVMQEVNKTGSLLDKIRFYGLGNASDEIVNKVRKVAEASAAAAKAARDAAAKSAGGTIKPLVEKKVRTAKASDPLASLLASTDIGRLAEFDKQVALLNARFDGGRKNTELYTQAMTKLVNTTFSANFTEFNKQLADQDETQRLVADHLKATNDELYAQQQAWSDAGAALTDEMRTPLENANLEFGRLQELLDRGVISWETYTRAVMKTQDALEKTPDKLSEMDTFAKTAAENIQNSFSDFLFNPFDKGLDGMLKSFGQTIQRMIADAVAADLAKSLFGDLVKGGSGSGVAGSLFKSIGSLFSFDGGGYTGAGPRSGGVDGRGGFLSVLHPNETVVDHSRGQSMGGGHTINVYVNGGNAPDVRRAAGQGAREGLAMIDGARRYA